MPIQPEKLDLTPEEIRELVTGAQKYLAPVLDPRDEEHLIPAKKSES